MIQLPAVYIPVGYQVANGSLISVIGYDTIHETLGVEFVQPQKKQKQTNASPFYIYKEVPFDLFRSIMGLDPVEDAGFTGKQSIGGRFNGLVKNAGYEYQQLESSPFQNIVPWENKLIAPPLPATPLPDLKLNLPFNPLRRSYSW